MIRKVWSLKAGEMADFLEKEIAAGRNPTNPKEWDEFMKRAHEAGVAKKLAEANDN